MVVYEAEGKVRVDYDPPTSSFWVRWTSVRGLHFQLALEHVLAHARKHGVRTYISDSRHTTDTRGPEELDFARRAWEKLRSAGATRVVVVVPRSVALRASAEKMGAMGRLVGLELHVASNDDEVRRYSEQP